MATKKEVKSKAKVTTKSKPKAKPSTTQQNVTPENAIGLTLTDLATVAQIINLTSQRGAFQADELAQVGELYNKLIKFLTSVGAITPNQTAPEQAKTTEKK